MKRSVGRPKKDYKRKQVNPTLPIKHIEAIEEKYSNICGWIKDQVKEEYNRLQKIQKEIEKDFKPEKVIVEDVDTRSYIQKKFGDLIHPNFRNTVSDFIINEMAEQAKTTQDKRTAAAYIEHNLNIFVSIDFKRAIIVKKARCDEFNIGDGFTFKSDVPGEFFVMSDENIKKSQKIEVFDGSEILNKYTGG